MIRFPLLIVMISGCLLAPGRVQAQEQPVLCGTWYDYDAAGNRIKRFYDCKTLSSEDNPPTSLLRPGSSDSSQVILKDRAGTVAVFPNPTTGVYHIRVPQSETAAHFHIYDATGRIVSSGYITGGLYDGTLEQLASGNYLIVVYFKREKYDFLISKH